MTVIIKSKRSFRSKLIRLVREGAAELRVYGSQTDGFRLGVEYEKKLYSIGYTFTKQTLAVEHGERLTGKKAKKIVNSRLAA